MWKQARMAGDTPILTGSPSQKELEKQQEDQLKRKVREAEERYARMRGMKKEVERRKKAVHGDHILFVNRDGETKMGVLQTDDLGMGLPMRLIELGEIDGYMAPVFGEKELKEILSGRSPRTTQED